MPITMSDANIDDALQTGDSFNSANVDFNTSGGATLNTELQRGNGPLGWFRQTEVATGASLAGITPDFVSKYNTVVETYKGEVNEKINKLSNPAVNQAFKGEGLETALNNFVDGVKAVAAAYNTALSEVQTKMAAAVAEAYGAQDTDLSGQLGSDTSNLDSSKPTIS